jgi:hypothetical protein
MVTRFFLDTNAVISLFAGNMDIAELVAGSEWSGFSIITKLEFLAYSKITAEEEKIFHQFCKKMNIENLDNQNENLVHACIRIRREKQLKLPDAIIAAQSLINRAQLITSDPAFGRVDGLSVFNFLNGKQKE